ncbi:MAG: acyl-CoA thioesterase [Terrimicrobiaceae bacterium]|nr:acyl-CoA thioesterase [Terrimicrobiaceae bacterium]
MGRSTNPLPRWLSTVLWGNTVALSWMWGLGLFFSVQFTTQFGLFGLLTFAIPNFLGLMAFGLATQQIANRQKGKGSEALASFFVNWSRPFRLIFFLYQILAITLTIFAIIHYVWQPLNLQPQALYLPLTLLVVLAAAVLFGEEFNIKRIKFSHGLLFLLLAAAIVVIVIGAPALPPASQTTLPKLPVSDWNFWGYVVPICIGFLAGPWLDLQQWQRAIQMHRERVSIGWGYVFGSVEFFALLLFHGGLTLWAQGLGASVFIRHGIAGYTYAQDMLMQFFFHNAVAHPVVFIAYCVFVCVCILTTLDSGYIAFRWFLQSNVNMSNNAIFSLIPNRLVTSPIPIMLVCGVFALTAAVLGLELEYFMIFFATFLVGYEVLGIARCYVFSPANAIPQVKMFCIGSVAVVIFAFGYFLRQPVLQIIGSMLPLGYVVWLLVKPTSAEEFVSNADELESPADSGAVLPSDSSELASIPPSSGAHPVAAAAAAFGIHDLTGHFEGKWFVHSFVATYADTNSVGNVYFGMYAMWVGKTRELFFNKVMPKFNLKDTSFYILTRSFEHKFVRETREFETVSVRIKIASFNRKFVTLEHEIYDSHEHLLGKGRQSLLFVSSADYHMLDIPQDVHAAFLVHT